MKIATIKQNPGEIAAIVLSHGVISIDEVNKKFHKEWPTKLLDIVSSGALDQMTLWYNCSGKDKIRNIASFVIPFEEVEYGPLYRNPSKIWGIGLNYVEHAEDLAEKAPSSIPASFMKADTTIVGSGDEIIIPLQSEKTAGEAELGVIFGKKCKNVERENWLNVVAGFTPIIDVTAEDILRQNPRYLTLSKNFDTFFSFGPHLVTPDEIDDVNALKISTVINGKVHAENVVSNMTFPPDFLVSFHSKVYTCKPGDVISTGTPRAVPIQNGDVIECWIDGFTPLKNPVRDLKKNRQFGGQIK